MPWDLPRTGAPTRPQRRSSLEPASASIFSARPCSCAASPRRCSPPAAGARPGAAPGAPRPPALAPPRGAVCLQLYLLRLQPVLPRRLAGGAGNRRPPRGSTPRETGAVRAAQVVRVAACLPRRGLKTSQDHVPCPGLPSTTSTCCRCGQSGRSVSIIPG